jgi:hypothetical protein
VCATAPNSSGCRSRIGGDRRWRLTILRAVNQLRARSRVRREPVGYPVSGAGLWTGPERTMTRDPDLRTPSKPPEPPGFPGSPDSAKPNPTGTFRASYTNLARTEIGFVPNPLTRPNHVGALRPANANLATPEIGFGPNCRPGANRSTKPSAFKRVTKSSPSNTFQTLYTGRTSSTIGFVSNTHLRPTHGARSSTLQPANTLGTADFHVLPDFADANLATSEAEFVPDHRFPSNPETSELRARLKSAKSSPSDTFHTSSTGPMPPNIGFVSNSPSRPDYRGDLMPANAPEVP